ncbi:MAG: hypothetical protein WC690_08595, partial [bacterium]
PRFQKILTLSYEKTTGYQVSKMPGLDLDFTASCHGPRKLRAPSDLPVIIIRASFETSANSM